MEKKELLSTIAWVILVSFIGSSLLTIIADLGVAQPSYVIDGKHIVTLLVVMAVPTICGYLIGRDHE